MYFTDLPVPSEFQELFIRKTGKKPRVYADKGYEAVMIYAEAFSKTDGSAGAIKKFFHEQLDFVIHGQRIRFDPNGDVIDGSYEIRTCDEKKCL